tara:strand:- start:10 stop:579 length:570 start_codon:yes stop_codon:yes gene_type:complete
MIHSTHTRKDLIDIIETYNLYDSKHLIGYNDMAKDILSQLLWRVVSDKRRKLDISNDTCFFFKCSEDLSLYLSTKSPNIKLKNKDYLMILNVIKNLNYYCKKCNYIVEQSNYDSIEDIIKDADIIKEYGNEAIVRRCIKLLNKDIKIKDKLECVMSNRTKKTIELKNLIKQDTTPHFKIKRQTFTLDFS